MELKQIKDHEADFAPHLDSSILYRVVRCWMPILQRNVGVSEPVRFA